MTAPNGAPFYVAAVRLKSPEERARDAAWARQDYAANYEAYRQALAAPEPYYLCPGCGSRSRAAHSSICGGQLVT